MSSSCILLWLIWRHRWILVSLALCCRNSWKPSSSSNCPICSCNLLLGGMAQPRSSSKMIVLLPSTCVFLRLNRLLLQLVWLVLYLIRPYAVIWIRRQLESGGSLSNNSIAKVILVRTIYLCRIQRWIICKSYTSSSQSLMTISHCPSLISRKLSSFRISFQCIFLRYVCLISLSNWTWIW